jgi:hypothetical protein
MNKFFRELTKRNWGWPYHVILADLLAICILTLYSFLWSSTVLGQLIGFTWLSVNAIGAIYEVTQVKKDPTAKDEFWEDIIGNNCGIILGCFKFWLTTLL